MGVYGSPDLNNQNTYTGNNKAMIYCTNCGCHYSKHIKKCPQCGQKHARPFYQKWWFWFFVVVVVCNIFGNSPTPVPTLPIAHEEQPSSVSKSEIIQISEDEYKSQCTTVFYTDIARNPNDFLEQKVVFTGKVIQVQENGKNTVLRVNVTQGDYGIWEDTIYVDYSRKHENESRILEDDIVTLYGELNGLMHYTAVLGNQISIPHILAQYIDIV